MLGGEALDLLGRGQPKQIGSAKIGVTVTGWLAVMRLVVMCRPSLTGQASINQSITHPSFHHSFHHSLIRSLIHPIVVAARYPPTLTPSFRLLHLSPSRLDD